MGLYATFATPDHSFLAVSLFTVHSGVYSVQVPEKRNCKCIHTIVAIRAVACIVQLSNPASPSSVRKYFESGFSVIGPIRWESCQNPEFATASCLSRYSFHSYDSCSPFYCKTRGPFIPTTACTLHNPSENLPDLRVHTQHMGEGKGRKKKTNAQKKHKRASCTQPWYRRNVT